MNESKTRETKGLLLESGAMLEGHFVLSSGRHSDRYFQCARLLMYPSRAEAALAGLALGLAAERDSGALRIDAVVGPALGGILVAYELARQLGLPALFTERGEEGTMSLRRGFELAPGSRVLIAEDVVTTGKSSRECAEALAPFGVEVAALACIVDRRTAGVELEWPLYAAAALPAETWDAATCPLCAKGLKAVKPGSRRLPLSA